MDRPQERDLFICLLFSNQRIGLDFPPFTPFFTNQIVAGIAGLISHQI